MSKKSIPGTCPNCGKEGLIIAVQKRNFTDWQIKYGVECEFCGYTFLVDRKAIDDMLTLLKNKEKTT